MFKHRSWIAFSGFLWFSIGLMLLYKGIRFIAEGIVLRDSLSASLSGMFGSQQSGASALIAIGLILGFIKGKVLLKSAKRIVDRIYGLPLPIRATQVYAPSYFLLIACMVGLGFVIRFLPIPIDLRGLIDVAIGSALLNGSMFYFRSLSPSYTSR